METTGERFTILAGRHLLEAYRLAYLVVRDHTTAEDVAQQALATAWAKFASLRDEDRFGPWFLKIVVNLGRDELRKRRRLPRLVDLDSVALTVANDTVVDDSLTHAFGRLSPDERVLIVLRFYRDLKVQEISTLLDVPEGTVKSRLHRALSLMKGALEQQEFVP